MFSWCYYLILFSQNITKLCKIVNLVEKYALLQFTEKSERSSKENSKNYRSTYFCTHWLLLVCPLTRGQTCNLGVSAWSSNQLSYLAGTTFYIFSTIVLLPGIKSNLFLWIRCGHELTLTILKTLWIFSKFLIV